MSTIHGNVTLPDVDVLPQGKPSQYLAITVDDFKELLNRIAGAFKTRKALADALDIDPSRLSRAINDGDIPFNVENCLRLAKLSGESPSKVLRAAGKADIAELIESLYGPEKAVNDRVIVKLLKKWNGLAEKKRDVVRLVAEVMLLADVGWPDGSADVPLSLGLAELSVPSDRKMPRAKKDAARAPVTTASKRRASTGRG